MVFESDVIPDGGQWGTGAVDVGFVFESDVIPDGSQCAMYL